MEVYIWQARGNLSLRILSDMTGIPKSTLNDIENNKKSPTLKELELIAVATGYKITDLFSSKHK